MVGGNIGAAVQMLKVMNQQGGASQSWESYWASHYPSDLLVNVVSDSQIDLSWINNGDNSYDEVSIERSLNSYEWTEIDILTVGESEYTDEDVTANTVKYYYRIRYKKELSYSPYSRIVSMFWNEIVVNGQFVNSDYWLGLSANNWSISGGEAIFSATTNLNKTLYRSNIPVKAGKTYKISFEISAGETPRLKIGDKDGESIFADELSGYEDYPVGTYIIDAICNKDSDNVGITGDNESGSFRLSSLSIKEIIYPVAYKVLSSHTYSCVLGSILYAINGQYLEKSLDYGDTWIRIEHAFIGTMQSCFVSKDGILFVNCGDQGIGGTEIWRSIDDGLNWTKVLNTNYGVIRVPWDFAQSSNGTIFIGEYTQSYDSAYLWKSTNDGLNWTRIDDFFVAYSHFHQVFVDPETQRLYVGVGDTSKDTYYSDDEGSTWHQIFADVGFETGFVSITSIPGVRYFGTDSGASQNALYKSVDDIILTKIYKPSEKYNTYWIEAVVVEDNSTLYTMVINTGGMEYSCLLAKSVDNGNTWFVIMTVENSMGNFQLPTMDYRHKIPKEFGYLITRTQENDFIRIEKEVETWGCLTKPSELTLSLISGGVRLNWTDNTGGRLETEIWGRNSDGTSAFISSVKPGITTYDDICNPANFRYYKLRTKVRFDYSEFTDEEMIEFPCFTTTWQTENAGSATKTIVIPTTGGGYNFYVKWDDEPDWEHITGTPGDITHEFATIGIKTVKIVGVFPRIYFNNTGDKLKLLTIENWGSVVWSNMANAFRGCSNLTGNYTDFPDTSLIEDMSYMFAGCVAFNSPLDIDTGNVKSMDSMFNGCTVFNQPVNFNTAKVTTMASMFYGCTAFNQSVANFNTAKITSMKYMFRDCTAFNQSVANFNTAKVITMASMFYGCTAFNQSVANFNTIKVTDMSSMFRSCYSFNQSLSNFNVSLVTTMYNMLTSCTVFSTSNYDALLISWAAQSVKSGVNFGAGTIKYSLGDATTARGILTAEPNSWNITDGGQV